jgi:hypothetical protein
MKKMIFLVSIAVPIFGSAPVQSNSQVEEQKREIVKLMTRNEIVIKESTAKIQLCDARQQRVLAKAKVAKGLQYLGLVLGGLAVAFRLGGCTIEPTIVFGVMSVMTVGVSLIAPGIQKGYFEADGKRKKQFECIRSAAQQSLERQSAYLQNPDKQPICDALKNMHHMDDYEKLLEYTVRKKFELLLPFWQNPATVN